MFSDPVFWKYCGLTAIGVLVGLSVAAIILSIVDDRRMRRTNDRQFNIDCIIVSSVMFAASALVLIFVPSIPGRLLVILSGFGVSGFAGRWIGLTVVKVVVEHSVYVDDWVAYILALSVPTITMSLLAGLTYYYWPLVIL